MLTTNQSFTALVCVGGRFCQTCTVALALAFVVLLSAGQLVRAETAVTEADTIEVRISHEDCLRLVPYEQPEGVAYEPGVDVRGEPVAPAEVGGGVDIELPETITIPIEVDLLSDRRLGDETSDPGDDTETGNRLQGEAQIGTLDVDVATGRATFNGQPLQTEAQRHLSARCQEILKNE